MGTDCGVNRNRGTEVRFKESTEVDSKNFYDVIVSINSIKDIITGWNIILSERFKKEQQNLLNKKALKIGIIGNSNKGKSFILSQLSKIRLPSGTSIKTEGLSIKYPDLTEYKDRNIVLLDSAGLENPVLCSVNGNNVKEKNRTEIFKEKSREKIMTELFLQDYIIHNSDILIIVVGILSYSEQKTLNRIKIKLKRENIAKKTNNSLFIIHNLMTYTTIAQIKTYIKNTLLQSATFELEEQLKVNVKENGQIGGICFFEKDSNPKIFHLIFANADSEAGNYYNNYTLLFLVNSFESNINLSGFNIVKTIQDRFKEVSKDFFENLQSEIEFENSDSIIKLKKPKELTLKQCFIDELGFSNIKAIGFEPNYSYYITNNHIIVKIEAPGNCTFESAIQLNGEYIVIKINGNKVFDEKSLKKGNVFYNGREYGKFSLDIPIKQENFIIKNERPIIQKEDGIFIIYYQIEVNKLGGQFVHPNYN